MPYILLLDVAIAYALDLLLGDPHWLPHPVRFIGWLISRTEKVLRRMIGSGAAAGIPTVSAAQEDLARKERLAGAFLCAFVVGVTFALVWGILKLAAAVSPVLFHILNIYFLYSALATKCLADEARKVYKVLLGKDIVKARKALSMLVGRQTENLSEEEIIRGVVETTAENTVDGVISPLIYAVIGSLGGIGAPLVYAFKAASTLDSMVGYMNDRYINFGRASARLDDAANYLPARLSGLLIPAAAALCGKSFKNSFTIMKRDRRNHKSPNCAYSEAAVAGALGVRLGGTNIYFGRAVEKPTIGDPLKKLEPADITDTIRLSYTASFLALMLAGGAAALATVLARG